MIKSSICNIFAIVTISLKVMFWKFSYWATLKGDIVCIRIRMPKIIQVKHFLTIVYVPFVTKQAICKNSSTCSDAAFFFNTSQPSWKAFINSACLADCLFVCLFIYFGFYCVLTRVTTPRPPCNWKTSEGIHLLHLLHTTVYRIADNWLSDTRPGPTYAEGCKS